MTPVSDPSFTPWTLLPHDLQHQVLDWLDPRSLSQVARCKDIAIGDKIWRKFHATRSLWLLKNNRFLRSIPIGPITHQIADLTIHQGQLIATAADAIHLYDITSKVIEKIAMIPLPDQNVFSVRNRRLLCSKWLPIDGTARNLHLVDLKTRHVITIEEAWNSDCIRPRFVTNDLVASVTDRNKTITLFDLKGQPQRIVETERGISAFDYHDGSVYTAEGPLVIDHTSKHLKALLTSHVSDIKAIAVVGESLLTIATQTSCLCVSDLMYGQGKDIPILNQAGLPIPIEFAKIIQIENGPVILSSTYNQDHINISIYDPKTQQVSNVFDSLREEWKSLSTVLYFQDHFFSSGGTVINLSNRTRSIIPSALTAREFFWAIKNNTRVLLAIDSQNYRLFVARGSSLVALDLTQSSQEIQWIKKKALLRQLVRRHLNNATAALRNPPTIVKVLSAVALLLFHRNSAIHHSD